MARSPMNGIGTRDGERGHSAIAVCLPPICFVEFNARRLTRASCVFVNRVAEEGVDWSGRFAFATSSCQSPVDVLGSEGRTLFAERYGGFGIGRHGGGVRCGTDGEFQVKGVGCNPLLGDPAEDEDFWHSHGGLALVDAVQEAAWGEVLQRALPFGAVRTSAILSTGMQCWYEEALGKRVRVPGALAVRRAPLRIAHFERAVYFRPRVAEAMPKDVTRVRAAIARLPDLLPQPKDFACRAAVGTNEVDRLSSGMLELSRRLARQSAAAKARRLMHGGLNGSNCCLDGRWLDFGTVTLLPSHANIRPSCAPHHALPFWDEHQRLLAALSRAEPYLEGNSQRHGTRCTEGFCTLQIRRRSPASPGTRAHRVLTSALWCESARAGGGLHECSAAATDMRRR